MLVLYDDRFYSSQPLLLVSFFGASFHGRVLSKNRVIVLLEKCSFIRYANLGHIPMHMFTEVSPAVFSGAYSLERVDQIAAGVMRSMN